MKDSLIFFKFPLIFFSKVLSKERRTEEKVQWELYLEVTSSAAWKTCTERDRAVNEK